MPVRYSQILRRLAEPDMMMQDHEGFEELPRQKLVPIKEKTLVEWKFCLAVRIFIGREQHTYGSQGEVTVENCDVLFIVTPPPNGKYKLTPVA